MDNNEQRRLSRRNFLKGVPLGIAGAFALTTLGSSLFKRKADRYPNFPEGSIFTPADRSRDA